MMGSVVSRDNLCSIRKTLKRDGKTLVFTNGVFDILHRGHVDYLAKARALGDVLAVGVNSDASVQRIKGPSRPIVPQDDRAYVLAGLESVAYVCLFEEDTPYELIRAIVPDILVKGADWPLDAIVGKDVVEAAGGSVQSIEVLPDRSTTLIIKKILENGSAQT